MSKQVADSVAPRIPAVGVLVCCCCVMLVSVTCPPDLPAIEIFWNGGPIVERRLVSEVVRLVAEVVGDRKGQISRNKVDGHVQNLKPAFPNRKRSHD